ncbi:MAG TPA: hypothetical protein ENK18_05025 [Deltaproteobacteria bacterium]|nr:hypothetical protein [Deltaproteobacteria bacterium]
MELFWGVSAGGIVGICVSVLISWGVARSVLGRIEARVAASERAHQGAQDLEGRRRDTEIRILQARLALTDPPHSDKERAVRSSGRALLLLCSNLVHAARHGTRPETTELSRFRTELGILTPIAGPRGKIWRAGRDVLEHAGSSGDPPDAPWARGLLERIERLASALQHHHSEYDGAIYPFSAIEAAMIRDLDRRGRAGSEAETLIRDDPPPPGARFTLEEVNALGSTRWAEATHSLDESGSPDKPFALPPSRVGATIISFDDDDPQEDPPTGGPATPG